MRRKTDVKSEEKPKMIQFLSHVKTNLDILKLIPPDHRTVKRFFENSNKGRGRSEKGNFRKITRRQISSVKKTLSKNSHSTSVKSHQNPEILCLNVAYLYLNHFTSPGIYLYFNTNI